MQIHLIQILACLGLALSAPAQAQSLSAPFTVGIASVYVSVSG
jgi:hypothetical protein